MRTNIVIDDELMAEVTKRTKYKTKTEAVNAGLELLVRMANQAEIIQLRGKLKWDGDLEKMRLDD